VEDLYAVPPAAFTATRNRVSAELRKAGRAAEAQAVARLRKPSVALWAANQLARDDRQAVGGFIAAVERLKQKQLRDPRAVAEALREQRGALDALVGRARRVLKDAGLGASPAILRRISHTLLGAAVDRAHAEALRRGTLTEELPAPGFEAFTGARVPAPPLRLVSTPPTGKARPGRQDDAAERRAEAEERQRRLRQIDTLRREAEDQARRVEQVEAEVSQARAKLSEAQEQLKQARRDAKAGAAAVRRARRETGPS
jgi:hypothetical protein